MKIIKDTPISDRKGRAGRRVLVELDADDKLIAISPGAMYKLGYPHEDIVGGHVLADVKLTTWCSLEQKWIE
jgi:hypothetical protein